MFFVTQSAMIAKLNLIIIIIIFLCVTKYEAKMWLGKVFVTSIQINYTYAYVLFKSISWWSLLSASIISRPKVDINRWDYHVFFFHENMHVSRYWSVWWIYGPYELRGNWNWNHVHIGIYIMSLNNLLLNFIFRSVR